MAEPGRVPVHGRGLRCKHCGHQEFFHKAAFPRDGGTDEVEVRVKSCGPLRIGMNRNKHNHLLMRTE